MTLNFRYTSYSRPARECGTRLVTLTAGYEDLAVPRGTHLSLLIELALVARGRHLLQGAYQAADRGDDVAAAILLRSLNECVMRFAWLMLDSELGAYVLRLEEIRTRLSHHRAYARIARNQRRSARRRGELVTPLGQGETLGILDRASVRRFTALDRQLRREAQALPGFKRRLKRLGAGIASVPSFETQATKSKNPWMYVAAYRFDSNSAAHPGLLALQQFVEDDGTMFIIRTTPTGPRPDPYAGGAVLLGALAQLASQRAGHPSIDKASLAAIDDKLRSLPPGGEP